MTGILQVHLPLKGRPTGLPGLKNVPWYSARLYELVSVPSSGPAGSA